MKYASEFDPEHGICVIRVTGNFHRLDDSDTIRNFIVRCCAERKCCQFLIDLTRATLIGGTLEIYQAVDFRDKVAESLRTIIRAAFVRTPLTADDRFYETMAYNRGYHLKAHDSVEKAVEWLLVEPCGSVLSGEPSGKSG